ncbi:MAG: hypothetical protein VZS44_09300 [Bacilli bacterium]|nr:hypothetical protein [Bacilli bacterium]
MEESLLIKKLEQNTKERYGIKNVSYEGLSKEAVNEIILGIESVYEKYPLIFPKIDAIGSEKYIKDYLISLGYNIGNSFEKANISKRDAMACIVGQKTLFSIINLKGYEFITVVFGPNLDRFINPKTTDEYGDMLKLKSITTHELGHVLCNLLFLDSDVSLKKELISIDPSKAKLYENGLGEAVAYSFQAYMCGIENNIINTVVSKINEKYAELELKESKIHR